MSEKEEQLQEELGVLRQDFKDFCYRVSHDLQGSLRNVGGFLSLIEGRCTACFDDKSKQYLGFVKDGTVQAQSLLEGLTEYSYLLSEEKNFSLVDLEEILKSVMDDLKLSIHAKGAKVKVTSYAAEVLGDRALLRRALRHVIDNALLYTEKDPRITITLERKTAQYLLTVSDEGIGMDREHYRSVFKPFERLHTQAQYPGIGLGLTVAQRVVEAHHGRIWLEAEEGPGCSAYIAFPLRA